MDSSIFYNRTITPIFFMNMYCFLSVQRSRPTELHAGAKGTRLTSSAKRNVRTLCCRWFDRGRIISKRCALILQKEPVSQGGKTETCPGHRLDRGLTELDIHICRFELVPANTTAAANGLATTAGRRLNQSAADWILGVYSALSLGPKSRR